jgi:leucyl aminopeptidase
MKITFSRSSEVQNFTKICLIHDRNFTPQIPLSDVEQRYLTNQLQDNNLVLINRYNQLIIFALCENSTNNGVFLEQCRKRGNELCAILRKENSTQLDVIGISDQDEAALALVEGITLGSYKFLKYRSKTEEKSWNLSQINFVGSTISPARILELSTLLESVFMARDLVNEPASHLNSVQLGAIFESMGIAAGFETEIFQMDKIKTLKMGGLLAVNQGSIDPPTFSVLKWEPANAKNSKPIVLVGKGVVYDTGGLSLKPTKDSMDAMKCDMAGGAVVAAVMYYAAKCKLPIRLIALVPSTDNRPDGNAYAPGDVIVMHSGTSVEVLNTDAEGRLILADALSYAKQFQPQLAIDVATLTGSAAMAIGHQGIVGMGNAAEVTFQALKQSGENVYERVVEFPLWEEYGESIKSDIADLKNIGSREAGAITAGKFLEHFVDYPWIHLDIAGPAFLNAADHYRPKGGTGTGVRLLIDFITHLA